MKAARRAMCQLRLERIMARRLNQMDQMRGFGLGYGNSIRVVGGRAALPPSPAPHIAGATKQERSDHV